MTCERTLQDGQKSLDRVEGVLPSISCQSGPRAGASERANVCRDPANVLGVDGRCPSARPDASPKARERCSTAFHPACGHGKFLRARQLRPVARLARDFAKSLHFGKRLRRTAMLPPRATMFKSSSSLGQFFRPATARPSTQHNERNHPLKAKTKFRSHTLLSGGSPPAQGNYLCRGATT